MENVKYGFDGDMNSTPGVFCIIGGFLLKCYQDGFKDNNCLFEVVELPSERRQKPPSEDSALPGSGDSWGSATEVNKLVGKFYVNASPIDSIEEEYDIEEGFAADDFDEELGDGSDAGAVDFDIKNGISAHVGVGSRCQFTGLVISSSDFTRTFRRNGVYQPRTEYVKVRILDIDVLSNLFGSSGSIPTDVDNYLTNYI
ncbi:unnamed protein product [Ambrosiozyma monospora]|uniref:Unnamed protein product n=1 Tax=Ambrosiozyma monospora TaxID=43982 RepID=A0ACB5SUX3_AMBMO|nr:unnamed protein product [Ambrosiozyma monospora]